MSENGIQVITEEIAAVFMPLRHLNSRETVTQFFLDLGYELPGTNQFGELPGLIALVEDVVDAVGALAAASSDEDKLEALADLLEAILRLAVEINSSIDQIKSAVSSVPNFNSNSDIDELPRRLLDYLLSFHLWQNRKTTYGLLLFIGVLDEIDMPADAAKFQPSFTLRKIWWERFPDYFTEPQNLPETIYQWESNFNHQLFIGRLYTLFSSYRLPGGIYKQSSQVMAALGNTTSDLEELRVPVFEKAALPNVQSQFGINVTPVEQQASLKPGFGIIPYLYGAASFDFDVSEKFEIIFEISGSIDAGLGLVFRPDTDIVYLDNIFTSPAESINIGASLEARQKENTGEIVLVGEPGSSRIAIEGPGLKVFVANRGEIDAGIEASLQALRLVVSGGDGDGFINVILGDTGITAEVGFGVGVSKQAGVYFVGSGGLEVKLPTHIELGPLEIQGLTIALKFIEGDFKLDSGVDIKLDLGALVGVVENIGISSILSFPDEGGNLGPADLGFAFKPPNGVGLSINAGVVSGGGYLYFDFDAEEYAGVLELDLSGIVSVKAIGLITTKMPDGSKGFSLLLIITAEFGSPIQLGYGFTLSGVGGLLGLNRTMRLEVIAEGIRSGGINSIMFPRNVVENAPRIISDLKQFFPVKEGTFLIGPMVKIGWGTPNLVTVSLGIIIEIPGNIAILGVLRVALPDESIGLVVIQVSFIGAIEFDKKRLWFFASLFESRVLFITLEGEMGLLVGWGEDANFVVSVGGFHPAFDPPALPFGSIARIAISILNTDFARIRVEGYFAVTSNSVQFGAGVEIYFGVSAFNIDGHLAFDALFRFSPFYFIISISASLSVKVFGIGLFSVRMRGSLEGPTPWHVEGTGSISLLFFDIDVDFSHTWGNEEETVLEPITVLPLLVAEFEKLENWQSVLPASSNLLVSLREIEQGTTDLILHPLGSLKVSQRAVPLGIEIDKVGNQKVADANDFNIDVSTSGIDVVGDIDESFAVGQYFSKSDNELLNAKSFEPIKGGVDLAVSGEQYHAPRAVRRTVRYEKILIDTHYKRFVKRLFTVASALFGLFLNGNAVSQSKLSRKQARLRKPFDDKIAVGNVRYAVALNSDNTAYEATAIDFSSQAKAIDYMNKKVAADPNLAKQLHVIPQVELQRAA